MYLVFFSMYFKFKVLIILVEGGYGLGDPAPDISLKYWKLSSDAGHAHSIWNSGIFYFNGFGTNQDIVKGLQMIQNGMELNTDLKFPPQLSDMNQKQIDILIKLVSKSQKEDQFLDIDQLEQLIKVAKDPQVIAMNPRIFKRLVEITILYILYFEKRQIDCISSRYLNKVGYSRALHTPQAAVPTYRPSSYRSPRGILGCEQG